MSRYRQHVENVRCSLPAYTTAHLKLPNWCTTRPISSKGGGGGTCGYVPNCPIVGDANRSVTC